MNETLSLYLHIPFCRVKCTYCDFNTYTGLEDQFELYTQALCAEIEAMGRYWGQPPLKTIFIGGGTPTVLTIPQLATILDACRTFFDMSATIEVTSEANPGTVDTDYLRELGDIGVNRVSFGAQSFNPAELEMLGRYHTAEAIGATVQGARRASVTNLNLDLIYGLPYQTLAMWQSTLEETLALHPEHISLYSLTLERGTALNAQVARGERPLPDSDLAADMYELADELLAPAGYTQYEISNWCQPGYECQHNLTYWRNQSYLGCGPGAHSYKGNQRWWNVRPVPQYLELLQHLNGKNHPHPTQTKSEPIDLALEMGETMMLGLRLTQEGVLLPAFESRFGKSIYDIFGPTVKKLKAVGLLQEKKQRLLLTPKGRLLGNQVFMQFLPD